MALLLSTGPGRELRALLRDFEELHLEDEGGAGLDRRREPRSP